MILFLLLGSIFSLIYQGAAHWYFPGAAAGVAGYFGYAACFALAALIALKTPANTANEVVIIALKALLPVSGIILFVYGIFLQFFGSTSSALNGDVLDTTSSMTGPLCVFTGIFMVVISLWTLRKNG